MRTTLKLPILLSAFLLSASKPAIAFCELPQPRLVCAEYFASQVVVEATLVKINSIYDKADPGYVIANVYGLHAEKVFRGVLAGSFRIYEGNDSGRATFDWKIGRKYVLFLFYVSSEKAWGLDGCGNSAPVSAAKGIMKQIDEIKAFHGPGVIHGVVSHQNSSDTVPGVQIEAKGLHGTYSASTNAKGEFEISVPPGRYVVHASKPGLKFDTYEFSYEDPENVRIEPGGCAQIQLVARPD